jgi:hypothetical protein
MYAQHFTQGSTSGRYFTCSQSALAEHYSSLDALMRHRDAIAPPGQDADCPIRGARE